MDEIHDGSHIGRVDSGACEWSGGDGRNEIGRSSRGERIGDTLAVTIAEQDGSAGLGKAGHLLIDRLLETLFIRLESECRSQLGGVLLNGLWVILRNGLNRGQITLDALLLEGRFIQVDIGANEQTGLASDGGAKSFEIATRFRRDKDQRLLRFTGNDDGRAFSCLLLVPGIYLGKPIVWRLVGRASKKSDDQQ